MTKKQATDELNKRQAELDKLNAEKGTLTQQIGALQAQRSEAVKQLAGGDEKQRKIITDIEAKIADLSLRLEGTGDLIEDAQGTVAEANKKLKKALAEEAVRLSAFIAERDRLENDKLISSLPEREKKIVALFQQLCQELAELQIDMYHFGQNGAVVQIRELEDLVQTIPMKVKTSIEENNLRPLITGGYFSEIRLWPYVAPSSEISAAFPGKGLLYPEQIAGARREKRVQALTAEYQSNNE